MSSQTQAQLYISNMYTYKKGVGLDPIGIEIVLSVPSHNLDYHLNMLWVQCFEYVRGIQCTCMWYGGIVNHHCFKTFLQHNFLCLISFPLFVRKGKQKNYISVFNLQIVLYLKSNTTFFSHLFWQLHCCSLSFIISLFSFKRNVIKTFLLKDDMKPNWSCNFYFCSKHSWKRGQYNVPFVLIFIR